MRKEETWQVGHVPGLFHQFCIISPTINLLSKVITLLEKTGKDDGYLLLLFRFKMLDYLVPLIFHQLPINALKLQVSNFKTDLEYVYTMEKLKRFSFAFLKSLTNT